MRLTSATSWSRDVRAPTAANSAATKKPLSATRARVARIFQRMSTKFTARKLVQHWRTSRQWHRLSLRSGGLAEGEDQLDFAAGAIEMGGDFLGGAAGVGELVNLIVTGIGCGGRGGDWAGDGVGVNAFCARFSARAGGGAESFELGDLLVGIIHQQFELGGAGVELGGDLAGHFGELD